MRSIRLVAAAALLIALAAPALGGPRTLARGASPVALDRTYVYFVADGVLSRVPRAGGAVEPITRVGRIDAVAVTSRHVWWLGDGGIERARKGTRAREVVVPASPDGLRHLVAAGEEVWFTAGARDPDGALGQRILVIRGEGTRPERVADLPRSPMGYAEPAAALAVDGGAVIVAQHPLGFARVERGGARRLFDGIIGPPVAVGGGRIATGHSRLTVRALDGSRPRTVASGFLSPGGLITADGAGAGPWVEFDVAHGRRIDALVGGGGRLVVATSAVEVREPRLVCGSCVTVSVLQPGSARIAVIEGDRLVEVATGEEPVGALAVDARGIVWIAGGRVRILDR
jgi:hypothetical protein